MPADRAAVLADPPLSDLIRFGPSAGEHQPFVFDRESRLLWRDGVEVPLPPRVLGVLLLLLTRPGQVVSKQELISAVWRDAFVTETSLAEAVSVLRQALGDDPQHPTFVQTLHRRGYRLIAGVQTAGVSAVPQQPRVEAAPVAVVETAPSLLLLGGWMAALLAVAVAGTAIWQLVMRAPAPISRVPIRFALGLPAGVTLSSRPGALALSRDGSIVAFSGCRADDCAIYLRPLSQTDATLVNGTGGGQAPFLSADARSLGFFADGRLKTIALANGSPVEVADAPDALGAVWLPAGRIVFAAARGGGLSSVPASGGPPERLTSPLPDTVHAWPDLTADGESIVFTVSGRDPAQTHAAILPLRGSAWNRLIDDAAAIRATVPGYMLAQRGGELVAVRFDARTRLIGSFPVPVVMSISPELGPPAYAIARDGTLVHAAGRTLQVTLNWDVELARLVPLPAPALPR